MIVTMERLGRSLASIPEQLQMASQGLRTLTRRQVGAAVLATLLFGGLLGLATVLIPNSFFTREIPPVWWNYPVWILTSVFAGLLFATYVRDGDPGTGGNDSTTTTTTTTMTTSAADAESRRSSRIGMAGAFLAWFAVGCPVCNKFALLALGYSGAITWFAPVQPVLAVAALVLTGVALTVRLRGRVACVLPRPRVAEAVR